MRVGDHADEELGSPGEDAGQGGDEGALYLDDVAHPVGPDRDALIAAIIRTANGRLTAAEALGHREFVMTKLYRSA